MLIDHIDCNQSAISRISRCRTAYVQSLTKIRRTDGNILCQAIVTSWSSRFTQDISVAQKITNFRIPICICRDCANHLIGRFPHHFKDCTAQRGIRLICLVNLNLEVIAFGLSASNLIRVLVSDRHCLGIVVVHGSLISYNLSISQIIVGQRLVLN